MRKILNIVKWGATLGSEPQNFLDAGWIRHVLNRVPDSKKRIWALRMLSLSPHYFLSPDSPEYAGMRSDEYLEAAFRAGVDSRIDLFENLLKPYFRTDDTVIDYGCGPGFLAGVLAPHVKKIYACDISEGVLACARILNFAENIEYVAATDKGFSTFPEAAADIVVSFAMIQHISDEIFGRVLDNMYRKLKPGGRLVLHIQLADDLWRTEEAWRADNSISGRIKFRYGLHCFGRTIEGHRRIVAEKRFVDISVTEIGDHFRDNFPEVASQRILTAIRPA